TPYTPNPCSNSADNFKAVLEGGTAFAAWVKGFSMTVKNQKRAIEAAGTLGPKAQGKSTFEVTGSFDLYNDANSALVHAKARGFTNSSFEFQIIDSLGNIQHFWFPSLYYLKGAPNAGAKDSDVMITLPFGAVQGSTVPTML